MAVMITEPSNASPKLVMTSDLGTMALKYRMTPLNSSVGRPRVRLLSGRVSSSRTGRMTISRALNTSGSSSTPTHQRGCDVSRLKPGRMSVASSRAATVTAHTSR